MRQPRIKGEGTSYYHCLSRVVDRRFIFGEEEKEHFVALMRKLEAFHGMRVVTYCVMSNHFHLLIEEQDRETRPPLDRETILKRVGFLYSKDTIRDLREEFERAEATGSETWQQEILDRYDARIGDLSAFMKELKQRFSQWYNKREGRRGTLWEDRYKSLLVEGAAKALMTVAAYIDLNPIRAGLVDCVEDYRWCGYASAVAGNQWAREGLQRIWGQSPALAVTEAELDGDSAGSQYRLWLYEEGVVKEQPSEENPMVRHGFTVEQLEAERENEGRLPIQAVLRKRVRYFSDGAVLGSREFVDTIFTKQRKRLGKKRKTGAREMRDANWQGLHVLRNLQQDRIG